ncbi:MAG: peroxiredoxin-like family protein [Desulfobacterales bacterium]|nr:peroxiredoxin-like family protein [Desulfobacterales bacterium]
MAQLRHAEEDIRQAGGNVVLVGMGTASQTREFIERFNVPFPMICDPDQHLYRDFSIERMSPLGFFSPTMALRGIAAMAQGHTMGLPEGDVRQLPGVVIVESDGRIAYRYDSQDPADHPSTATIVEQLKVL